VQLVDKLSSLCAGIYHAGNAAFSFQFRRFLMLSTTRMEALGAGIVISKFII